MHHIIMADPAEGRAQEDIGAWSETKEKLGILMIITEPDSPEEHFWYVAGKYSLESFSKNNVWYFL